MPSLLIVVPEGCHVSVRAVSREYCVWQALGHGGPHAGVHDCPTRLWAGRSGFEPDEKDVEIAVLRHQLMVLRRQVARPRYAPADRMVLAVLARWLPRQRWPVFLVTPATLLLWHRDLAARRWTYQHTGRGQQGLDPGVVDLVVRMARENPRWGYLRIVGECRKLGVRVSATSVRRILRRHRLGPAPHRNGPSWTAFLRAQAGAMLGLPGGGSVSGSSGTPFIQVDPEAEATLVVRL
jgi:hypothetical protein